MSASDLAVLQFVAAVVVGGGLILGFLRLSSPAARMRYAMRQAPRRRIPEVADGQRVRVVGRAEALAGVALLTGPLTGRPCLHWQVRVQVWRPTGKGGYWETIVDEQEGLDFGLRDGSDRALVQRRRAKLLLTEDHLQTSGSPEEAAPALRAFLAARGHTRRISDVDTSVRCAEGVIAPGEAVCVVGVGRWMDAADEPLAPGAGYREATPSRRLVLRAPSSEDLLLSDEEEFLA